ncbi:MULTISPECIES: phosphate ABC transporter permease PstA [unclassified Colwellia]|uniref:phosphate ABC transporter permease PstA n=1 Tax=unclassified Colwellia TaxID=196834 RepID=UPI0015F6BA99|nr:MULTISPECIES: phosphate ABC transporter permease PstA [unclassified Colwellia]MBA6233360.1 phosphate ABC transporter permease PstA [Colwellia sp. MB02u-7]MBA6236450.1 phosphate ABC transporter permease PstA [Colwellia sp. MB02u-11]MBA6256984.1 phosphate ABC transporter permease PstA [Colwellia sp. MB3u-28]MBA6261011.1 phosphate ABC transporter permease PstA [Colwellia sp. MB3u-41]MBA6298151.1 phosphate ABC transporter permease PstA [Colwellia sp. MB3u-22]
MNSWFKSGSPWVWLSAGGVSISLISVLGLLWLIASRGLSYFWPADIYQFETVNEQGQAVTVIGEIYDRESLPTKQLSHLNLGLDPNKETIERILVKTGNRELVSLDFRWLLIPLINKTSKPEELVVVERRTNGNFYGYIEGIILDGKPESIEKMAELVERVDDFQEEMEELQKADIGAINYQIERLRLKKRKHILDETLTLEREQEIDDEVARYNADYQVLETKLMAIRDKVSRDQLVVRAMGGEVIEINFEEILKVTYNNKLSVFGRASVFIQQIGSFLVDDPREANTEGGVFPAIFGTVLMVLLMTVVVAPLGVVAAIYLHEYAGKNALTKLLRIAVINLAGVPSIVYGVFGLGFFVYMVGGSLDQLFYAETLPSPTFGTPGVMWSALTLAILTLPVVIVSTEEGLSRIPSAMRHGSLALGATKAETLWRIILPIASPAIMTGIILAIARAAGEVAPLMLVGVVKMAPNLPLDGNFPYLHLDRKFMHLGFHIYDVGFQSPNVEAARPLVFATAFLLVTIIVSLNMTAVTIRNRLREKYRMLEH